MLTLILLVFAFVLACIACWGGAAPWWNRLIAAALAFFFLAMILGHQVISGKFSGLERPSVGLVSTNN
jgi:hypothetical protein